MPSLARVLGDCAVDARPLDKRRAGERMQAPGDHVGERALARSVRPDESMDVAALHLEVDVPQNPEAGPVTELDAAALDGVFRLGNA